MSGSTLSLSLTALSLSASQIEVIRYEVVTAHLSLAKLVAMGKFVSDEIRAAHTNHLVFVDSDMVRSKTQYDDAREAREPPS